MKVIGKYKQCFLCDEDRLMRACEVGREASRLKVVEWLRKLSPEPLAQALNFRVEAQFATLLDEIGVQNYGQATCHKQNAVAESLGTAAKNSIYPLPGTEAYNAMWTTGQWHPIDKQSRLVCHRTALYSIPGRPQYRTMWLVGDWHPAWDIDFKILKLAPPCDDENMTTSSSSAGPGNVTDLLQCRFNGTGMTYKRWLQLRHPDHPSLVTGSPHTENDDDVPLGKQQKWEANRRKLFDLNRAEDSRLKKRVEILSQFKYGAAAKDLDDKRYHDLERQVHAGRRRFTMLDAEVALQTVQSRYDDQLSGPARLQLKRGDDKTDSVATGIQGDKEGCKKRGHDDADGHYVHQLRKASRRNDDLQTQLDRESRDRDAEIEQEEAEWRQGRHQTRVKNYLDTDSEDID